MGGGGNIPITPNLKGQKLLKIKYLFEPYERPVKPSGVAQSLSKSNLFRINEIMYVGLVFHFEIKNLLTIFNSFTYLTKKFHSF